MGWENSDILEYSTMNEVLDVWGDISEDLPRRVEDCNELINGGTVSTKDEAEKKLSKNFTGMMYVKVVKKTAKLRDAEELLHKERNKLLDFIVKSSPYFTHKGKTVGCKECGSSFPVAYFKRDENKYDYSDWVIDHSVHKTYLNRCPICLAEMRSDTALKRIEGYRANIRKYQTRVEDLEKGLGTYYLTKANIYLG